MENKNRYKMYHYTEDGCVEMDMPDRMKDFLDEIHSVCMKHGLSISHEDGHGAFIIEDYNERNIDWLFNAYKDYTDSDWDWLENLKL